MLLLNRFSRVWLFVTPWTAPRQASLSNTNSQSLLKLMSIKLVMSSNHLILCYSLLLLPSIFPSIRVFSSESVLHIRWPKYWSFSFSISPSNEHSGLISFRIDWFDLLAVQETLKNPLQHHSSKTSVLWCSALSMVQLSIHAWLLKKTIALTRWSFVSNVSLLLNMLSRFFHSFSSKEQVSFNFKAAVTICSDFGVRENKVCHCFHFSPIYLPWSDGSWCHIFVYWMLSFKPAFSLSSFTFIKRLFSSSSISAIRVISAYLRLLIILMAILIPTCDSSNLAFTWCIMASYSTILAWEIPWIEEPGMLQSMGSQRVRHY